MSPGTNVYLCSLDQQGEDPFHMGALERLRNKHPAEALVGHARRTFCRGGYGSRYSSGGFAALISARQVKLGPPPRGWNIIM